MNVNISTDRPSTEVPEPGASGGRGTTARMIQTAGDNAVAQGALRRLYALMLAIVVGILCIPPIYYVIDAAVQNDWHGIRTVFDDKTFGHTMQVTIIIAVFSVVVSVVLGTLLAWGAQGLSGRSQWLGYIPLIPLLMPFLTIVMGFIYLFDYRIGYGNMLLRDLMFWSNSGHGPFNIYTLPWIVIVSGTSLMSFVYMFVRSALAQLDDAAYDAALSCGASPVRAFLTVILPMLRPALVYSALMSMLLALGQFTAPLFLGAQENIHVLSTSIYYSLQLPPPDISAGAAYGLPITAAGLLFIGLQRFILQDQDKYVNAGTKGAGRSLHKTGWLSRLSLLAYGLFVMGGPILSVTIVAFQPYWSKKVSFNKFTTANFKAVFNDPILMSAIKNSVYFAIFATLIVIPIGYACARQLYRRKQRLLTSALEVIVSIPLGVPAVIFGIGFLLAYTRGPLSLYGKSIGLIVVYVVIAIPFVTRIILVSLMSLGENLVEAGSVCGAPLWRRLLMLELPMLRPALGNAAAICVIFAMHEFSASVLVAATNTQVMGVALYNQFDLGNGSVVAALALVMCAMTAVCVVLALAVGRPSRPDSVWRKVLTRRRSNPLDPQIATSAGTSLAGARTLDRV